MRVIFRIIGIVLIAFGVLIAAVGVTSISEIGISGVIISLIMAAICLSLGIFLFRKKKKKALFPVQSDTVPVKEMDPEPVVIKEEPEVIIQEEAPTSIEPEVVVQEEDSTSIEPEYQYYDFKVAGISFRENDIIDQIMIENDDYDLSKREAVELGLIDERIYRYIGAPSDVQLIPEPDNPHDENAVKVISDGLHIGYVPTGKTKKVKQILSTKDIISISCDIYGGQYKFISEDYNDSGKEVYTVEKGKTNIGAEIIIKYK